MKTRNCCPDCGKNRGIKILWGLPTPKAQAMANDGHLHLGGCCIPEEPYEWICKACEHMWSDHHTGEGAATTFGLTLGQWYGWAMTPGYVGKTYYSPIYIYEYKHRTTNPKQIILTFYNANYAQGVQTFTKELRVRKEDTNSLIAEIVSDSEARTVVITVLNYDWIKKSQCYALEYPRMLENA